MRWLDKRPREHILQTGTIKISVTWQVCVCVLVCVHVSVVWYVEQCHYCMLQRFDCTRKTLRFVAWNKMINNRRSPTLIIFRRIGVSEGGLVFFGGRRVAAKSDFLFHGFIIVRAKYCCIALLHLLLLYRTGVILHLSDSLTWKIWH